MKELQLLLLAFIAVAGAKDVGPGVCDPLDPALCMLPWPNDFFTKPSTATRTGLILNLTRDTFPTSRIGMHIDPNASGHNGLDGFSPLAPVSTFLGNVDMTGLAAWWNISLSILDESETILLDAETGVRQPHWVELDQSTSDEGVFGIDGASSPVRHMFLLWPARKLLNSRRYIVAMRRLKTADGKLIQPSAAFLALRDGTPTSDVDVESRRDKYKGIFAALEKAGFAQQELQLAWDFTTGSMKDITGRLVHMRDDAFSRIRDHGPTIANVTVATDYNKYISRKITGTVSVPLYLTNNGAPGSRFVLGKDGLPAFQGFVDVPFTFLIPRTVEAAGKPAPVVQYGHGLFGSQSELNSGYLMDMMNRYGFNVLAVDWWGLTLMDIPVIVQMLMTDLTNFGMVPDRSSQGILNALVSMRMATRVLVDHPGVKAHDGVTSLIDPSRRYYNGNSCGGILGSVYMALTTDVSRGVLGVPGAPFSLLLPRSVDFKLLFDAIKLRFPDSLARIALMSILEALWSRGSPSGFLDLIESGVLAPDEVSGAPTPHRIVVQYGLGDAQVSLLGAYTLARSVSAVQFEQHAQESDEALFGFDYVPNGVNVTSGCVASGADFGVPLIPLADVPPSKKTDVHELPRRLRHFQDQTALFLTTGVVHDFCGGVCKGNYSHVSREKEVWKLEEEIIIN